MRFRTCSSARRSRWNWSASVSRSTTSKRLEQLDLLIEVEVRRVAGRIRQRARIGDRPHERADPPVVAAQLENFVDDRAVFALELSRERGGGRLVWRGLDVDAQHAVGIRRGARRARRDEARQRDGDAAAGEPHALRHLGDDADLREGVVVPGDEEHVSSLPTSTGSVTGIPGKYHASSSGMSLSLFIVASW